MEEIGLVHGLGGLLYHCKTVAENLEVCANLSVTASNYFPVGRDRDLH